MRDVAYTIVIMGLIALGAYIAKPGLHLMTKEAIIPVVQWFSLGIL